ncbi:MAG: adenosylmethionine decarboxylase [Eubacteriales bacterium]|nr:adenosylmethionine decarboxylase [Eubacteriales bacterium]
MAYQLLVDLHGCEEDYLNDIDCIKRIAQQSVAEIGAEIVEECVHQFEPIGISYIAVITTSHFSIHTWPEFGYAAIDIFSCKETIPEQLAQQLKIAFDAREMEVQSVERKIQRDDLG